MMTLNGVNLDAIANPELKSLGMATNVLERSPIKVVKKITRNAILPDRKAQLLRRLENAQSEVGRLNKLIDEIRADVLHLSVE